MFIIFLILGAYLTLRRSTLLLKTFWDPIFVFGYIFTAVGIISESFHDASSYFEIFRIVLMIGGGVLVACLCRDQKALKVGMVAYLIVGVYMAALLFLSTYGILKEAVATDFHEASRIRAEAMEESPLQANLNGMAFFTAQGAVVALALALRSKPGFSRMTLYAVLLLCSAATFLPMSRGGMLIIVLSCGSIILANGLRSIRALPGISALVLATVLLLPTVIFTRLTLSPETEQGRPEARTKVYTAVIEHLPEYFLAGVGIGNFWGNWGLGSGFAAPGAGVTGAHNCFAQVTLYWGAAGLFVYAGWFWKVGRSIPRKCRSNPLALSLLGILVSLVLLSMVIHNVYAKEFSLGLGLLAGARRWVWPSGVVPN